MSTKICKVCNKTFTSSNNRIRHERNVHQLVNPYKFSKFKCSECNGTVSLRKLFDQHVLTDHPNIELKTENLLFTSEEAFENWLLQTQMNDVSVYVMLHKYETHYSKNRLYQCHRSGTYNCNGRGIRKLKRSGSNKIGYYCPSRIYVNVYGTTENYIMRVRYHATHLGHEKEVDRLPKRLLTATAPLQQEDPQDLSNISESNFSVAEAEKRTSETKWKKFNREETACNKVTEKQPCDLKKTSQTAYLALGKLLKKCKCETQLKEIKQTLNALLKRLKEMKAIKNRRRNEAVPTETTQLKSTEIKRELPVETAQLQPTRNIPTVPLITSQFIINNNVPRQANVLLPAKTSDLIPMQVTMLPLKKTSDFVPVQLSVLPATKISQLVPMQVSVPIHTKLSKHVPMQANVISPTKTSELLPIQSSVLPPVENSQLARSKNNQFLLMKNNELLLIKNREAVPIPANTLVPMQESVLDLTEKSEPITKCIRKRKQIFAPEKSSQCAENKQPRRLLPRTQTN